MNFSEPRRMEYIEHFRPGMGTENVGSFLRSFVQLVRPTTVLEIGAGYTTPFLLEGLVNNERVLNDGNLREEYFRNYVYEPKLVIIDDMSLGDLIKRDGMADIISSSYVDFIEGVFQGKASQLAEKYTKFDLVWFDCGASKEYKEFFSEYWEICSSYIICHFTYTNGKPNENHIAILDNIADDSVIFDILEPHKDRQGSLTVIKKTAR